MPGIFSWIRAALAGGGKQAPAPPPAPGRTVIYERAAPADRGKQAPTPPDPGRTVVYERNDQARLGLACLSGPLKGQLFPIGPEGLMVGRDYDCGVCFPCDTLGVSRHHCSIRWYRGGPAVVDLGSSYGSFLADGRRLPANAPVPIQPGCRFSLGIPGYSFELVSMETT